MVIISNIVISTVYIRTINNTKVITLKIDLINKQTVIKLTVKVTHLFNQDSNSIHTTTTAKIIIIVITSTTVIIMTVVTLRVLVADKISTSIDLSVVTYKTLSKRMMLMINTTFRILVNMLKIVIVTTIIVLRTRLFILTIAIILTMAITSTVVINIGAICIAITVATSNITNSSRRPTRMVDLLSLILLSNLTNKDSIRTLTRNSSNIQSKTSKVISIVTIEAIKSSSRTIEIKVIAKINTKRNKHITKTNINLRIITKKRNTMYRHKKLWSLSHLDL